ncbi:MAG: ISKra4 family transposase, partial [Acidobacteriaceae bacterium]
CAVTRRQTLSPVSEIMPDRCTPEYERVVAKMGASLPYRRARTLLSEFLPLDDIPSVETARQRTIRVGARLEKEAVTSAKVVEPNAVETKSIALSIDGGHVRSVRHYQVRSLEVLLAQVTNDDGKQIVFSSVPAEAISQQDQLRLDGVANGKKLVVVAARRVARLLRDLKIYIFCGQSDIVIDYAAARHQDEPISTAVTESTVQWLLHRRMNAQQHMRWSPRGAHLMLKVRTATVNGTLERDHAVAERSARRPFRRAA